MSIVQIVWSGVMHTQNLYTSIFGEKYSFRDVFHRNTPSHWSIIDILQGFLKNIFPKVPFHCPSWMPAILRYMFFGNNSIYLPSAPELHDNVCVIFLNGILTNRKVANSNRQALSELLHRPVNVLHNATDSLLCDVIECLLGKTNDDLTEASLVVLHTLCKKLLDPQIEKLVVVAHSQGTIVIANALRNLHRLGLNKSVYLQKLELYCFSNCASQMKYVVNDLPYIESFANTDDLVARLGCHCATDIKHLIHIDGATHFAEKSGHLFNEHYINTFQKDYPNSRLLHHIVASTE